VRVDEARSSSYLFDAVAIEVAHDARGLELTNRVLAGDEPADGEVGFDIDRHSVQIPLPVPGEEQGGLAQGLRGQRARVDRGPAWPGSFTRWNERAEWPSRPDGRSRASGRRGR